MAGTIIGFVIGYWLGMRDGKNGSASELRDAWQTIRTSPEFKAVISSAPVLAGQVMQQGLVRLVGSHKKS